MANMDRQQEFVLRTLEERDIRFVRLWFTDVSGYLKAVAVAPAEIEAAFAEGIGFDGSAIEGFARIYESDMLAKPDPATFQVMPATKGGPSDTARMFCDITLPDGSPAWADPRHVLRRARISCWIGSVTSQTLTFMPAVTRPSCSQNAMKAPSSGLPRVTTVSPGPPRPEYSMPRSYWSV